MDHDVVIFTACDQAFFPLCVDLVASLKKASPRKPRIRVLDVGMLPAQAKNMAKDVEAVIEPNWDLAERSDFPAWFRAMTARPFLPKYAGNAAIVAWIDSDAWVQCWEPLGALIVASRDGRLAIVEERYGRGYTIEIPTSPMSFRESSATRGLYGQMCVYVTSIVSGLKSRPGLAIFRRSTLECLRFARIRPHGRFGRPHLATLWRMGPFISWSSNRRSRLPSDKGASRLNRRPMRRISPADWSCLGFHRLAALLPCPGCLIAASALST